MVVSNPGKPITIYNVASLANKAFTLAFSKQNLYKGFEKTGIWPLNCTVFSDEEFLMSYVTDRPKGENMSGASSEQITSPTQSSSHTDIETPEKVNKILLIIF